MDYVVIGKILNTFGIKGELKVRSYSDFDSERYSKGSTVYLGEEYIPMKVKSYREHKGFLLVLFEDHEDINLVEKYKNYLIFKSKDDIKPLKDGEYYFSDLIGLKVYVDEKEIGKVINVEEGIRNNNMRILKYEDNKEYLVPFLDVFVKEVDLKQQLIRIVKMDGLL